MNLSLLVLCWVALSTLLGIFFGYSSLGLTSSTAIASLVLGFLLAGVPLFLQRGSNRLETPDRRQIVAFAISIFFLVFAVREFSQAIFVVNDEVRVISPNNLGDICLHLTQINYLASGPHFWPENPIFAFDKLRYPIGVNVFNAELKLVGIDTKLGIVLFGLVGSLITLRALYLFNGSFGVAAFLFNGGLAGFLFFQTYALKDYQADVAWKSIPLALFVTQRGLLYAIPAGLLLLRHWRTTLLDRRREQGIPAWTELLLYCTMPLFHPHTFLFLSFLLLFWFLFGDPNWRTHFLRLILLSLIPATFFAYVVTGFSKTGAIGWKPDWMAGPNEAPWWFWLNNFGLFLPASLALFIYLLFPSKPLARDAKQRIRLMFFPAAAVFLACSMIKFAPWEWDNTKLFFWAYMVMMFCLWEAFLTKWHPLLRAPVIFGLFFSGFISLVGGICANPQGYGIGRGSDWRQVADATRSFNPNTVFATYPTYNHPVMVNGHRVVMGFPGHLWSHGLNYQPVEIKLVALMNSGPGWQNLTRELGVDYLFWGPLEQAAYPGSQKEWEKECRLVAGGSWGSIYDLHSFSEGDASQRAAEAAKPPGQVSPQ
ncbi:MAG: hypothetical protein JO279_04750 [Verrucomicrobia bacterium]|nr:hypothetical protein [Verrucomicrobiota bacterium]